MNNTTSQFAGTDSGPPVALRGSTAGGHIPGRKLPMGHAPNAATTGQAPYAATKVYKY